ncbi:MAG TPA: prepilin-type N-terminal cleavage/methylation domain-containing protein [Candidatus Acidoferrales bacterium]|nr:prepilin-type N-terminal cleavage/methylation domain-containing protein [Candidatus Acidoferrales bacterium]
MRSRKQNGFSLIELLIVIAIILIIAAIAIPNLLAGKMAANEASAVQSLRTIQSAQTAFATTFPSVGYAGSLPILGGSGGASCVASSTQACLVDPILAGGQKSGYNIVLTGDGLTPSVYYWLTADPILRGSTGHRSFFTDYPGVIRYNETATATVNDAPI